MTTPLSPPSRSTLPERHVVFPEDPPYKSRETVKSPASFHSGKSTKSRDEAFAMAKGWSQPLEDAEDDTEPGLWGRFANFVRGSNFDMLCGIVVIANAVVMILQLEYASIETARLVQHPEFRDEGTGEENWPAADVAFTVLSISFNVFFILELLLRLKFVGMEYVKQPSNWADIVIVAMSVLDFFESVSVGNMTFLRLVRILKLARVLRIVRALKLFRHLRLLLLSIKASISALFWSLVLLLFIIVIASIFMTQTLTPWLRDENNSASTRHFVYEYFGSFSRSLITMFQVTLTPGVFGVVARKVIYSVHTGYAIFFISYVSVVSFAIIRVITAMFIKETLDAASSDVHMVHSEELRHRDQYLKKVQIIFDEFDANNDGEISVEEIEEVFKKPSLVAWFKILGIDPKSAEGFFLLMQSPSDKISCENFVDTVMRMKGGATKVDLANLVFENRRLIDHMDKTRTDLKEHQQTAMLSTIEDFRCELISVTQDLRLEVAQVRDEIAESRAELADVRVEHAENVKFIAGREMSEKVLVEIAESRVELADVRVELAENAKLIAGELSEKVPLVAEGLAEIKRDAEAKVVQNAQALNQELSGVRDEVHTVLAEIKREAQAEQKMVQNVQALNQKMVQSVQAVNQKLSGLRDEVLEAQAGQKMAPNVPEQKMVQNVPALNQKMVQSVQAVNQNLSGLRDEVHTELHRVIDMISSIGSKVGDDDTATQIAKNRRFVDRLYKNVEEEDLKEDEEFPKRSSLKKKPSSRSMPDLKQAIRKVGILGKLGEGSPKSSDDSTYKNATSTPASASHTVNDQPQLELWQELAQLLSKYKNAKSTPASAPHTANDQPQRELWQELVQLLWRWTPQSASGEFERPMKDRIENNALQPQNNCKNISTPSEALPHDTPNKKMSSEQRSLKRFFASEISKHSTTQNSMHAHFKEDV